MFVVREAFRCGLFFPPEVEGELPIAPLFIFNASFPASECPTENTERFNSYCHSIVRIKIKLVDRDKPVKSEFELNSCL